MTDTPNVDLLKDLSGSAVKVYLALRGLTSGYQPFAASLTHIQRLTGLTHETVSNARKELIQLFLLKESFPPGYYAFIPQPVGKSDHLLKESFSSDYRASIPRLVGKSDPFREGLSLIPKHKQNILLPKNKRKRKTLAKGVGKSAWEEIRLGIEARRLAVKKACAILGIPESGRFVQAGMRKLYGLQQDGFTIDDALAVVQYCRAESLAGDRFKRRLNLIYIWSVREFSPLLSAARTPFTSRRGCSDIADPEARREWHEDYQRRVKEKGLA